LALLNDNLQEQVRQALAGLEHPVKLVMFTQGETPGVDGPALECPMCLDTRQLIEEVAGLSDKISVQIYDFQANETVKERYKIDKIPAIALVAVDEDGQEKDYGIRYYGIPSGYEFSSLIEDLRQVSKRTPDLYEQTLEAVQRLDRPVHIQVFVTPT
jgi:glutaredoxin-like protein